MTFTFQKIGRYLVPHDVRGVQRLCLGLDDPFSVSDSLLVSSPVLCSPLRRAAGSVSGPSVLFLDELKEIPFDPLDGLDVMDKDTVSSSHVRTAFLRAWKTDQLGLKRAIIRTQILKVLKVAGTLNCPLIVSHSFRLKLFQGYSLFGERFFQDPDLLAHILKPEEKTFEFCQRISLDFADDCLSGPGT